VDRPRHHAVIAGLPNVLLQCARVPAPPRSHTSGVLTLLPSPRACNSALTGRGAIDLPGAPRSTHARARNPTFHRPRGSGNGFRNGLQQALHVLQLRPSFIQPVSSQRRHTGGLRGGAAVLITATCLLVSSSSRFPIAVVSSMIDPFICFLLTTENAMIDHGGSPHLSHSSARRCSSRLARFLALPHSRCFLNSHGVRPRLRVRFAMPGLL